MKLKEIYLLIICLCVFIFCEIFLQTNIYYTIVITYQVYTLLRFINNLGHEIALFDFFLFYACLDTLTLSIFGYEIYNKGFFDARVWGKTMDVPLETYYSYLIPCNLALFASINFFLPKINYEEITQRLKMKLRNKGKAGIVFILLGIFFTSFQNVFPPQLMVLSGLLQSLRFVGPLYILFSDFPFKMYIFYGSLVFMLLGAIASGMFGDFLNSASIMIMLLLPLFKDKVRFSFGVKLISFLFVLFLVLVLQSIKPVFRDITWRDKTKEGYSLQKSSGSEIFRSLMWDRITNPEKIFDRDALFSPYVRFNQGVILAKEFAHVPAKAPHTNGSHLVRVFTSILIPRIFYPDKYELGGVENMRLYLGINLKGYSMNIGPFGEMYGDFGPNLGVFFVFLYGLLILGTWRLTIRMVKKNVIWVLWISNLYYYTLTVETDMFGAINTFVKNFFLIFILLAILERTEKKVLKLPQ